MSPASLSGGLLTKQAAGFNPLPHCSGAKETAPQFLSDA